MRTVHCNKTRVTVQPLHAAAQSFGCPVATCCSGHTMFDNTILAANKEGRRALTLLMTFPSLRIVEMAARGDSDPPLCAGWREGPRWQGCSPLCR